MVLSSRPMRAIGRVSYGLYVYHPAIIGLIALHMASLWLPYKFGVYVGLSYGVSLISFYGAEKRFIDMKQRLASESPH